MAGRLDAPRPGKKLKSRRRPLKAAYHTHSHRLFSIVQLLSVHNALPSTTTLSFIGTRGTPHTHRLMGVAAGTSGVPSRTHAHPLLSELTHARAPLVSHTRTQVAARASPAGAGKRSCSSAPRDHAGEKRVRDTFGPPASFRRRALLWWVAPCARVATC